MKNKVINLFGDKKIVENKGVKYSQLLEQFLTPFINELEEMEDYEDIIEFGINTWNTANIKQILSDDKTENIIDHLIEKDLNNELLIKMVEYKINHFKEYTNFIVDYKLRETDDLPILTVITQEQDAYLANILNELEEEEEDLSNEYDENYINRSAIIIKPLQPFFHWLNTLYPGGKHDDDSIEPTVYLVDEDIEDIDQWLKKKFDKFFMIELEDWHTNKKNWPQKRNYKMFTQWFQVFTTYSVFDLEKRPVLKSE